MEEGTPIDIISLRSSNKLGSVLLLVLSFILPFIIFSRGGVMISADKHFVFALFSLIALISFAIWSIRRGLILVPRSWVFYSLALVWLATLLASLFSLSRPVSLFGSLFSTDTLFALSLLLVVFYLVAILFQNVGKVALLYVLLFASSTILFVLESVHLLGFEFWGILPLSSPSFIGAWYERGLFFGFIALSALALLVLGKALINLRRVSLFVLVISSVALFITNFSLAWWLLGIGALSLALIEFRASRVISWASLVVALVAAVCLYGGKVGGFLLPIIERVSPAPIEVRPSWTSSLAVTKYELGQDPLLGVGPNLFAREWQKGRPIEVNKSQFWNLDFDSGVGQIPTRFVTAGLLGGFSWLLFLFFFCFAGVKMFRAREDSVRYLYAQVSFIGATYLWLAWIFYGPLLVLQVLTFLISGVFLALCVSLGFFKITTIGGLNQPLGRAFSSFLSVLVIIVSLWLGYSEVNARRALFAYSEGLQSALSGDASGAIAKFERALVLSPQDMYARSLSDLYFSLSMSEIASVGKESKDVVKQFMWLYGKSVFAASLAVSLDQSNYLNHLALGNVHESAVQFSVPGAYENAKSAYSQAALRNPSSPAIPFQQALLEMAHGDKVATVPYLNASVALKPNYAPTYLLASQIAASSGDLATAIKTSTLGTQADPSDFTAFFQLGYLYYRSGQYKATIDALGHALALNPSYANARYFLGLSHYQTGNQSLAISEFEQLKMSNPGNTEIDKILANLRAGKNPITE